MIIVQNQDDSSKCNQKEEGNRNDNAKDNGQGRGRGSCKKEKLVVTTMKHHLNLKRQGWSHSDFGSHCHSSFISMYTTTVHPQARPSHTHICISTDTCYPTQHTNNIRTYVRTYIPTTTLNSHDSIGPSSLSSC